MVLFFIKKKKLNPPIKTFTFILIIFSIIDIKLFYESFNNNKHLILN